MQCECLEKRRHYKISCGTSWYVIDSNPTLLLLIFRKSFFIIRVRESYRDALRFHWIKNQDITQIDILTLNVSCISENQLNFHFHTFFQKKFNLIFSLRPELGREGFRFTKLVFGLTQSPFVLEATLFQNTFFLKICPISKYREVLKKLWKRFLQVCTSMI